MLEPPLQIAQPNKFKIIHMDIPIVRFSDPDTGEVKEDMVFCTDILDALTQDFFARKGNPIDEPPHVEEVKVGKYIYDLNYGQIIIELSRLHYIDSKTRGGRGHWSVN